MPIKINIYNKSAESVGELKLSDKVFGLDLNADLMHQALVTQMANERQVLAHTKTKGEVRGGGKKPWKQKGTGRARAGSSRSPIWIGGGVTFGPRKDRNFSKKINKKMKQKALMMVFSDKVKNNSLIIVDKLEMAEFKTKTLNDFLKKIEVNFSNSDKKTKRSILVVNDNNDKKVFYSGRNLAGIEIINLENVNIMDLLKNKNLLITESAIKKIDERYSKE
ncbi:50S ribosomal protein L4 [Candidatus Falkowbacteria bacterium HGW-Falkowbacteria-1]|uniref:Large ribosomal subunit protein uL4 n=1 Tax=Candidatus Falkowbacteria bacterium HGW-Falkowbacteria-1 TaxID=2013768 RepID=A0A2N2E9A7_9BACT|nr:MAG: 50S ribosomal protein L4 [Candidatus Falkowbacteria bacterium HGW-Falkowbacteria-1]